MFNFRIINLPDGNQVIDPSLKTSFKSLTFEQMEEYIEVDNTLAFVERMKKQERKQKERRRKLCKSPFWKLACFFGIITA